VTAKKDGNKEQVSFFVDPADLAGLRALSASTLAPVGALIRAAIKDYLAKRKVETEGK